MHSTETALLNLQNNIVALLDSGEAVVLPLLDLSAVSFPHKSIANTQILYVSLSVNPADTASYRTHIIDLKIINWIILRIYKVTKSIQDTAYIHVTPRCKI